MDAVSLLVEVPENLHESVLGFLQGRPDWDQDRFFVAATALFLMQHSGGSIEGVGRVYLESLFPGMGGAE